MVNNLFQYIILTLLLINVSRAAYKVKMHTGNIAYYRTTSMTLITDANNGSTITDAINLYIPINNATTNAQLNYSKFSPSVGALPESTDTLGELKLSTDISNDVSGSVVLTINNGSDTSYKYVAVLDSPAVAQTDANIILGLSIDDICSNSSLLDCTKLDSATETVSISKEFYVYSMAGVPDQSDIDPADTDGVHLKINLSTVIRDNSSMLLKINSIDRGDESLYINYGSSVVFQGAKELLVINNSSSGFGNQTYQEAVLDGSSILSESGEFAPTQAASIHVKRLQNKTTYNLSVAMVDNYNFISKLSNDKNGTPEDIDEFLKSQQCYLLSAGFGKRHYIIDYFKMIRDRYLLKFDLGQSFVNFYYQTAPSFTGVIFKSKILSTLVRWTAYCTYFLMKYFSYIAIFLVLALLGKNFRDIFLSKSENKSLTR